VKAEDGRRRRKGFMVDEAQRHVPFLCKCRGYLVVVLFKV